MSRQGTRKRPPITTPATNTQPSPHEVVTMADTTPARKPRTHLYQPPVTITVTLHKEILEPMPDVIAALEAWASESDYATIVKTNPARRKHMVRIAPKNVASGRSTVAPEVKAIVARLTERGITEDAIVAALKAMDAYEDAEARELAGVAASGPDQVD